MGRSAAGRRGRVRGGVHAQPSLLRNDIAQDIADFRIVDYRHAPWRMDVMEWAYGPALRPNPYIDELVRLHEVPPLREYTSIKLTTRLVRAGVGVDGFRRGLV